MAEYILKDIISKRHLNMECFSRAVSFEEEEGNDIYHFAKLCLDRHNIPYSRHTAHRITLKDYEDSDYI